ncbi:MAG: PDZ domain-containing protein [Halanaerobiaceae bacterium]
MNNKKFSFSKIFRVVISIIILFLLLNVIPTGYNLLAPGIVQDLSEIITVENGNSDHEGAFYLTAVVSPQAHVWDYIYVTLFNPRDIELVPREEQIPPDVDRNEFQEIMFEMMEESQKQAQAIAFEKAGIDYEVNGDGVEVVEFVPEGTAEEFLEKEDLITEIDGQKVEFATDAVDLIQKREIGDSVEITVLRDEEELTFSLSTKELENNPGLPSIGVYITTKNLEFDFSRNVNFSTEGIGGPSAGGMFVLEIYNQLVDGDITSGLNIAGTGSVSMDGKINEISGVKQKVIAAQKENIDIFFVPQANYAAAKEVATEMEIVEINDVEEALEYLEERKKQI